MEKNNYNLAAYGKVVDVVDSNNSFSKKVIVHVEKNDKPICKYPEKYDWLKNETK